MLPVAGDTDPLFRFLHGRQRRAMHALCMVKDFGCQKCFTVHLIRLKNICYVQITELSGHDFYMISQLAVVRRFSFTVAGAARGCDAHVCHIGPWACGEYEPAIPGHRVRMTSGLHRFTFIRFPQVHLSTSPNGVDEQQGGLCTDCQDRYSNPGLRIRS